MSRGLGEVRMIVVEDVLSYCLGNDTVGLDGYSFVGRVVRRFVTGAFGKKNEMGGRREGWVGNFREGGGVLELSFHIKGDGFQVVERGFIHGDAFAEFCKPVSTFDGILFRINLGHFRFKLH